MTTTGTLSSAHHCMHQPECFFYLQVGQELWPLRVGSHPLTITRHAMLFIVICLPLLDPRSWSYEKADVCVSVCECVWMPVKCLPNRQQLFPEPNCDSCWSNYAALVSGQKPQQTGNLQVATVTQANPFAWSHTNGPPHLHPTTPTQSNTHPHGHTNHLPPLCVFSPAAQHPLFLLAWQLLTHHTSSSR